MLDNNNVSVCMTVYNGERYVRQQIESVLSELKQGDELLIFDDVSVDDTAKIVSELANDKRIKFTINDSQLGVVKNFERALQHAQGKYIFLCDQDDIWLPGKVQACVTELKKNLMVVTDCVVVNQDLEVINPSFFELRKSGPGILRNIWKNSYLGCCMAFRRELLHMALLIPPNMPMHDIWLGCVAEANGSVIFLDEKFSLYRRHKFTVSAIDVVSNYSVLKQIKFRLILIGNLIFRMLIIKLYGISRK